MKGFNLKYMNYSNKNNFSHGIIFHHFHNNKIHPRSQGSLSKTDLVKLIKFFSKKIDLYSKNFDFKLYKNPFVLEE